MRRRHQFVPSSPEGSRLEDRVVLNGTGNQVANSVLLQGLNGPARSFRPHASAAVASLVDLAYQSFEQDFDAVRATYFSAVENGTATMPDMTAFKNYTQQRTNLLAQQVINSYLLYSPSTTRGHGVESPLPLAVAQINGAADKKPMLKQGSPLLMNLNTSIVSPGSSATTITLSTVAEDNAIASSRVATLNGVTIVRNGNFGNGNKHSH